jgi:hypothetical protein
MSSLFTFASSSRCAVSWEPLTIATGTTGGTSCTGGAIPRWPTTSATPRGAGELASHRGLASDPVQDIRISRFLRLYSISLGLYTLQKSTR